MTKTKTPTQGGAWDLETGLPNDIDGYVSGAHFGPPSEKYGEKAPGSISLNLPLFSVSGDELGTASYSLGKDWVADVTGKKVTHPARKNFVKSASVGEFIERVTTQLKVPMQEYGSPTDATVWDELGFHWIQEDYQPLTGPVKKRLMPIAFLGEKSVTPIQTLAPGAVTGKAPMLTGVSPETMQQLTALANALDYVTFAKTALKITEVTKNGALLAQVLDDGPNGFYIKNKKS